MKTEPDKTLSELLFAMRERFKSGNSIQVERATLTREELQNLDDAAAQLYCDFFVNVYHCQKGEEWYAAAVNERLRRVRLEDQLKTLGFKPVE